MSRSAWLSTSVLLLLAAAIFSNGCGAPSQPPAPSYALTATALNPASITAGGTATSTITVTPSNGPAKGFTGSVFLSCSSMPGGAAAPICSFSVNPLVISTTVPVTSTLTVLTSGNTPATSYSVIVAGSDADNLPPGNGPQTLNLTVI